MKNNNSDQNILLITADSIRADYCGFLNNNFETTPNLKQIGSEGLIFENAISPGPRTPSSMPVIFAGSPYRTHDYTHGMKGRLDRIEDHIRRFQTISDRLKSRGYTTSAITANPWTTQATGFDQLFDDFQEIGSGYSSSESEEESDNNVVEDLVDYVNQWAKKTDWLSQWPTFYDEIQQRVHELEEPWFIWVFLLDSHSPYIVPRQHRDESTTIGMYYSALRYNFNVLQGNEVESLPNHLEKRLKASYRDSISSVDKFVGQIYDEIHPDETTLIFHSDHGEAFGEHGTFGHQELLYEENIRVPFIINSKNMSNRISSPISLTKLPQIIDDLVEEDDLNIERYTDPYPIARTEYGEKIAFCGSRWKFISDGDNHELYDLKGDPKETHDLSEEYSNLTNEFLKYHNTVKVDDQERERITAAIFDHVQTKDIT